jgi:glycosyltransferase involved in cell wall biosynthesis
MRIGLLLHEYLLPNSGSAGSTLKLGQEYSLLGHDVQYFSYDNLPTKLPMNIKDMLFPEYSAFHIHKLFRDDCHLDVIDGSTGDLWVWLKFFKKSYKNVLFVTRSHGLDHLDHLQILEDARCGHIKLSWKYPLYRGTLQLWEVASSLRYADLNFMLNQTEAAYVVNNLGVPLKQVYVFPNGIPQSFLGLPFEPTPFESDAVIRIAQIGTYLPRKGVKYSTPALNNILKRYSNVKVSLIGTEFSIFGAKETVYADFDPSVRDRVNVIPFFQHETLPSLLKGHHIKLFPTLAEGFGKALVEAMACGLTAVTTPTPGPSDIVTDGHDALVIPIRDTQAIESALERLIVDRVLLNQLRTKAYATAQKYSWRTIAQARLDVYEKTLAEKRLN